MCIRETYFSGLREVPNDLRRIMEMKKTLRNNLTRSLFINEAEFQS